ncbi:MAG: DUF3395 domain-containing protein [Lentisphaerae bacterium]|jgi:hypothetical protein|nr:DUF3395 domain-containing protein [Lentisphaerota bacterium]MBT7915690.1 DUF3395 domain-containing protein [Candidatus Bathyarchaeota archaeon]MBT4816593.1 DUF3395 domain-containing protein [Lentisphaerota bacterium]MBT5611759.1 DUF3395 domain-containing protein [Lentisphaerota bacterium]MBT7062052.1 DUF3395 domain-containing protein [Lentisphaerota bacterium]
MKKKLLIGCVGFMAGAIALLIVGSLVLWRVAHRPPQKPLNTLDPQTLSSQDSIPEKGLHIAQARFGASGKWVDVTQELRAKVWRDRLSISASSTIAGDPCWGTKKQLWVEYSLDGNRLETQVEEGDMLHIPSSGVKYEGASPKSLEALLELAEGCPAEIGFFGKNLTTGQTVEFLPDQPVCLASIVKIFTLLEVMHQVDQGKIELSDSITLAYERKEVTCTIEEAADRMVGKSDNIATDALSARVGHDRINRLPEELRITGLSRTILPEPGVLEDVLDKRVYGKRILPLDNLLPQHGSARGVVRYFELLNSRELISERISDQVAGVFDKHPKPFAPGATPPHFASGGKGGSLSWKRPGRQQYNMTGWALLIRGQSTAVTFCFWSEWFPEDMTEGEKRDWCHAISDGIVNVLLTSGGRGSSQRLETDHTAP